MKYTVKRFVDYVGVVHKDNGDEREIWRTIPFMSIVSSFKEVMNAVFNI